MKTPLKVLTFGVVSGCVWSVVANVTVGAFGGTSDAIAKVVSGVLAGVLISLALGVPLKRFGKRATILLGALSLPLGAFLYGFIFSIVGWRFLGYEPTSPLWDGYACAAMSVVSNFAIVFFALAIFTTFLLGRVIVPVKPEDAV
jgi:hypothetical protein